MTQTQTRTILRDITNWLIHEIQIQDNYKELEKHLIDPVLDTILHKLMPYIITSSIIFLFVLVFIVVGIAWFLPVKH